MSMSIQISHLNHVPKTPSFKPKPRATFRAAATSSGSSARELIQSGSVRAVRAAEAHRLGSEEGFKILDVRPVWEWEKARVVGSVHVALFVKDEDSGPITLLKKWVHFGYIGLWTGQYFTTLNTRFVEEVEQVLPDKNVDLIVACGEGLRSLMAITKLYNAGYRNLVWLAGGFNRSEDGDFPAVEGPEKLEYATIGGVSYIFLQLLILLRAVGNKS